MNRAAHPNPALVEVLAGVALAAGNLLDLRAAADFVAGHLRGAVSLPLEPALATVPAKHRTSWLAEYLPSIFLPPRHEPLAVVAADADLASFVARELTARGRQPVAAAGLSAGEVAALPRAARGLGPSRRRLWRPPPFLERWAHLLPPPAAGRVLDLACGSGRAAVWLAARGWRVTGIDHQPEALELARRLAHQQAAPLTLWQRDLRRSESLPPGPWSAVLLFRYLDRPLMQQLPAILDVGAVVMLRTFRDAPGYVGNPQPRHRLGRAEALRLIPGGRVLVHEEGFDADGRPAAGVVLSWTT